jgi:hypothetical protein
MMPSTSLGRGSVVALRAVENEAMTMQTCAIGVRGAAQFRARALKVRSVVRTPKLQDSSDSKAASPSHLSAPHGDI